MPMTPTKEAEIAVVSHVLYDLRFPLEKGRPIIERLVDDIGLSHVHFQMPKLAPFYRAAVETYAVGAQTNTPPSWADVKSRMERAGVSDGLIGRWDEKYKTLEHGRRPNCSDAAKFLVRRMIAEEATRAVEEWQARLQVTEVKRQISALCDVLLDIASGGEQAAHPSQILRDARDRGWATPVSTGYSRLDRPFGGGWTPPHLYVCGGASGHGKSSQACNFVSRRAEQGYPTLLCSLEMSREELILQMLCDLASVPMSWAREPERCPEERQAQAIAEAEELLDKYLRIYDRRADLPKIARRVRRHQVEFGGQLGLLLVDHLGRLPRRSEQSWSELEELCYGFADLGKEYRLAIMLYTQVQAETEIQLRASNMATYTEGRGSRGIKQAADVLMFICRHNGRDAEGNVNPRWFNAMCFQIAKMRQSGVQDWWAMGYEPAYFRLTRQVVADNEDIGLESSYSDIDGEVPF